MRYKNTLKKRFLALTLALGMLTASTCLSVSFAEEAPQGNAITKAIDWLKANQNENGSWGDNDIAFIDTSEVSGYLSKYGTLAGSLQQSAVWMEGLEILNNDVAARVLPFIGNADRHTSIKNGILAGQNEDGGWGIAQGYESDILDTVLVLNALADDPDNGITAMQKAASYIIGKQHSNGSWSFGDDEDQVVSLTAQAALALSLFQTKTSLTSGGLQTAMRKAGEYLLSLREPDKTWGTGEDSIAGTLLSYRAVLNILGPEAAGADIADASITEIQNADGSWYGSPYITALAIKALREHLDMPYAKINSIKLLKDENGTSTECYSYSAYDTIEIQADCTYGNTEARLLYFIKQPNGDIVQAYSKDVPYWDTSNNIPGTYSVIVAVQDNKTGEILASSEKSFDIAPVIKILSAEVNLDVDATSIGKEVNVNAQVIVTSASNIDKQLKIKTTVTDGAQEVFSSEKTVEAKAAEQTQSFDTLTFSPNADTAKDYIVKSEIFDGDIKLADGQSVFKVLPLPPETRVDAYQSLDKEKLYPGADSVEATIRLKGEGVILPQNINSLIQAVPMQQVTGGYANGKMYNDFIEYAVASSGSNNGRFTVGTTGGNPDNPNDNYKIMLYGHSSPSTSYTTIRVDGSNYIYDPRTQYPVPDVSDLSNTSEYTVKNLSVKQIISIVPNTSTQRSDVVQIKYVARNNDTVNHDIGIRVMLDTMLGNNDAAPFRIPGIGSVTTELELAGDEIPEYWQAFDSLTYPAIISQGTLLRNTNNSPDKVQFTNWRRAYDNAWMNSVNTGSGNGDSAVSVYWDPKAIAPGETREYVTYYGLSEFQQDLTAPLAVSLTGANNVQVSDNAYNPNPFTVISYITNVGSGTANNVKARIILPDGLKLADGQQGERNIGSLGSLKEQQVSWNVEIEPSAVERNLTYSVVVSADGIDPKTLSRRIYIPALYDDSSGKNAVFETYIPKGSMQIDTDSLSPSPADSIGNPDGSKTLRWKFDKIAIGEEKLIKIRYTGTNLASDTIVLLTRNSKLTYEDRNGTTVATDLPDLSIPVNKYSLDSKVATDKSVYTASEDVSITNTAKNLTGYPSILTGKIEITDINGNIVKIISENEAGTWNAGESKTADYLWNTGNTITGTYKARVTWSEGERVISIAETSFDVVADAAVSGIVAVDKQKYTADEEVNINETVKNNSTNNIENGLSVKTSITNSEGAIIWSSDNTLPELLPAAQAMVKSTWNTVKNAPGQYSVTMEVYRDTTKLSDSGTTFEIAAEMDGIIGVSGSLEVARKNISPMDDVGFRYTLNNTGNVKLDNVTARIRIVNAASGTVLETITDGTGIDVSSSYAAEKAWVHGPLRTGNYVAVLDAILSDGREVPLGSGYFTVEKPQILQSEALKYALFSGSVDGALCLYTYQSTINGDVRTNKSFEFSGTDLTISGTCSSSAGINTWGQAVQIGLKKTDPTVVEMPDAVNDIRMIASKDADIRSTDLMITDYGKGIEFSKSEISDASIQINGTSLTSKGYIVANGNVSFNLNSIRSTSEKGIVICSSGGDISINASSADLKGIVYAPNGTVYINAGAFKLAGRIIAKRIVVNCSDFDVTSSQSDLDLLDISLI